jgi:hypothetical protein
VAARVGVGRGGSGAGEERRGDRGLEGEGEIEGT